MAQIRLGFAVFAAWMAAILLTGGFASGPHRRLEMHAIHGPDFFILIAALFMAMLLLLTRPLWQGIGWRAFVRALPVSAPGIVWLLGVVLLALAQGSLPVSPLVEMLLSCLLIAFVVETVFRGVLLQATVDHLHPRAAIGLNVVLFAALHVLHTVGEAGGAVLLFDTGAALMGALYFVGLRLATGSVWIAVLAHFLWDVAGLLLSRAVHVPAHRAPDGDVLQHALVALLLGIPLGLHGIVLLRRALPHLAKAGPMAPRDAKTP